MAKRVRAMVDGRMLEWARETAGYSRDEVAARFKKNPDEIRGWEEGDTIFLGQLRELAHYYKRSLSDFYLPVPPAEKPIPHDFRREPGLIANVYSPGLRRQLRLARERRELALALFDEANETPIAFSERVTRSGDAEAVGEYLRQLLKVNFAEQSQWGNGVPAFRQWRAKVESLGVLVFQFEKIETSEVWGFCLAERPLPVIGINRKLKPNGRTFTLLHEMTHVLMNESSICDIRDDLPRHRAEDEVERFCNAVAAAALMPRKLFLDHPVVSRTSGEREWADDEIDVLSRTFGASREAVVRRLHTFGRASWQFYLAKSAQFTAQLAALLAQEKLANQGKDVARNMPQEALHNLGVPFIKLVLQTYADQRMTLVDAASSLGVRPDKLAQVESMAFGADA